MQIKKAAKDSIIVEAQSTFWHDTKWPLIQGEKTKQNKAKTKQEIARRVTAKPGQR